jgi:hypothetical protein
VKRCALLIAVACGSKGPPTPVGTRVGPALSAALAEFDHARAPFPCAGSPATTAETWKLGHPWKLAGNTLSTDGPITIGVIADAGGAAPATLAALGRMHDRLEQADLIIALGGIGATSDELEAVLGLLANEGKTPVVALAGDLEPAPALARAITALRARNRIVLDARAVRWIEIGDLASIATLPGAGSPARLAAGADGCGYTAADLATILDTLTKRPGLRILAASEAPRITVDHEPAGTLSVTPGAGQQIDLILHAPVSPDITDSNNGGREGLAVPLTPGTADATTRLPDGAHKTTIGLLTITKNGLWKWERLADH